MGVEYPRIHDAALVLVEAIQQRRVEADAVFLEWLSRLSGRLAEIRWPAFYHEMEAPDSDARSAVDAAERVLAFGRDLLGRLRFHH